MRLKTRVGDFRVEEVLRLPPPDPTGPYAVYRLKKKGLPTFAAAARIAEALGVRPRDVHFAGLKDARAAASQVMSVRLPAAAAAAAGAVPPVRLGPRLVLEPLHRAAKSIAAEDIIANRFRIVVRDLAPEEVERLSARLEAARADGVPNYFDDQRFGGASPERGFVAKLLIEGRVEEALRLEIARPSPKDPRQERLEKKLIAEKWGRWAELAKEVKGEAAPVVRRLAAAPGDLLGAFRGYDERLRALIVSQYQSWLWNEDVVAIVKAEVPKERRFEIMYRGGTLIFWKAGAAVADRAVPFRDLALPAGLGVKATGGARPLVLRPVALRAGVAAPDEAFPGRKKVRIEMELPRGAYATIVVKRIFYEP